MPEARGASKSNKNKFAGIHEHKITRNSDLEEKAQKKQQPNRGATPGGDPKKDERPGKSMKKQVEPKKPIRLELSGVPSAYSHRTAKKTPNYPGKITVRADSQCPSGNSIFWPLAAFSHF